MMSSSWTCSVPVLKSKDLRSEPDSGTDTSRRLRRPHIIHIGRHCSNRRKRGNTCDPMLSVFLALLRLNIHLPQPREKTAAAMNEFTTGAFQGHARPILRELSDGSTHRSICRLKAMKLHVTQMIAATLFHDLASPPRPA